MRVYIHIGTEKTGTTSIQQFLGKNKSKLIQNGVEPLGEFVVPGSLNNLALPLAANENAGKDILAYRQDEFDKFREKVCSKLSDLILKNPHPKVKAIICSSEHLSSRLTTVNHTRALRNLFPEGCDFRIIVYLREQHDLLLGQQAEAIKAGSTNFSFDDPRKRVETQPYGVIFYNFEMMLAIWEAVFGEKNIIVRPYENAQLLSGDVVADFLSTIGVADEVYAEADTSARLNKRLSPEVLFFLAKLNPYINAQTRRRIIQALSTIDNFEKGKLASNNLQVEFIKQVSSHNEQVAKKYLGRDWLFTDSQKPIREFDISDTVKTQEIIFSLMGKLLDYETSKIS